MAPMDEYEKVKGKKHDHGPTSKKPKTGGAHGHDHGKKGHHHNHGDKGSPTKKVDPAKEAARLAEEKANRR